MEEFSRHINFSEQNLCRGISIAVIFFATFFPITTDTSHVVVLQDSLAIAVNINEEI